MELLPHQKEFLVRGKHKDGCFFGTGVGKTLVIVHWNPDLLICPKGLKTKWQAELPDKLVMTKEEFRTGWKTLPSSIQSVAVDESHFFHGYTSGLHKALLSFTKTRPKLLLATATPWRKDPYSLYAVLCLLGYSPNYMEFRKVFFKERMVGWQMRQGRRVPKMIWEPKTDPATKEREVAAWHRIAMFKSLDEVENLPEHIVRVVDVPLAAEQARRLRRAVDPNPAVATTKMHQIEQENKATVVNDLAYEFPRLIVVARYTDQIDEIASLLRKDGHKVFTIDGRSKESHDDIAKAAEATEGRVVVVVQAQVGAGFELPSFPVMVYASMSYALIDYVQMQGRNKRLGKLKKTIELHLHSGGVDKAVYEAIGNKTDFHADLYAGSQLH